MSLNIKISFRLNFIIFIFLICNRSEILSQEAMGLGLNFDNFSLNSIDLKILNDTGTLTDTLFYFPYKSFSTDFEYYYLYNKDEKYVKLFNYKNQEKLFIDKIDNLLFAEWSKDMIILCDELNSTYRINELICCLFSENDSYSYTEPFNSLKYFGVENDKLLFLFESKINNNNDKYLSVDKENFILYSFDEIKNSIKKFNQQYNLDFSSNDISYYNNKFIYLSKIKNDWNKDKHSIEWSYIINDSISYNFSNFI